MLTLFLIVSVLTKTITHLVEAMCGDQPHPWNRSVLPHVHTSCDVLTGETENLSNSYWKAIPGVEF